VIPYDLDRVHLGDCLEAMRGLADGCVDAVVTDPPAGIFFMGRKWDSNRGGRGAWVAWLTEIMGEAFRVLKPGGHALVWALPRTSHWTAWALEDAGFEVRERIAHVFGTGFPKALDISKAIDKAAGAEREVVGQMKNPASTNRVLTIGRPEHSGSGWGDTPNITAPATPEAAQWEGWATALKPAVEDWWLCRKPLIGTVAANVLAHGTGALNIAATRVASSPVGQPSLLPLSLHDGLDGRPVGALECDLDDALHIASELLACSTGSTDHVHGAVDLDDRSPSVAHADGTPGGYLANALECVLRWWSTIGSPAGCPACCRSGDALLRSAEAAVRGPTPSLTGVLAGIVRDLRAQLHIQQNQCTCRPSNSGVARLAVTFLDLLCDHHNTRLVPPQAPGRWPPNFLLTHHPDCGAACVDGCPVAMLDSQSGTCPNGYRTNPTTPDVSDAVTYALPRTRGERGYRDSGAASRFYPNFAWEPADFAPFLYCAKASTSEREHGLDSLPVRSGGECTDRKEGTAALDCPRTGAGRGGGRRNIHPTVKPIRLMRWLCRLVTPPGGLVLDPFAGSGTTGVAAWAEGFRFLGFEQEPAHVEIANLRIAAGKPGMGEVRAKASKSRKATGKRAPTTVQTQMGLGLGKGA